jgi:hypothetical protein
LRSTRRSHEFYPADDPELRELMRAAYPFEGFYTYMLHQDLDHVMPYSLGRSNAVGARVVGPDAKRVTPLIAGALSDNLHHSLHDGVRKFVSSTAQQMVFSGDCTYEVVLLYPHDISDDATPVAFRLERIQAGTLGSLNGRPIQYVIASLSSELDPAGKSYVTLDQARLVTFAPPPDLVAPVREVMKFLQRANDEQKNEFKLMERSLTEKTPYDFKAHKREQAELFAAATQAIGWNVRGLFNEYQLEPLIVWREICFQEFKARLRSSIMLRLNETLSTVGNLMGFDASIELFGVPRLDDVHQAKDDLRTGRRSLSDVASWAI